MIGGAQVFTLGEQNFTILESVLGGVLNDIFKCQFNDYEKLIFFISHWRHGNHRGGMLVAKTAKNA